MLWVLVAGSGSQEGSNAGGGIATPASSVRGRCGGGLGRDQTAMAGVLSQDREQRRGQGRERESRVIRRPPACTAAEAVTHAAIGLQWPVALGRD